MQSKYEKLFHLSKEKKEVFDIPKFKVNLLNITAFSTISSYWFLIKICLRKIQIKYFHAMEMCRNVIDISLLLKFKSVLSKCYQFLFYSHLFYLRHCYVPYFSCNMENKMIKMTFYDITYFNIFLDRFANMNFYWFYFFFWIFGNNMFCSANYQKKKIICH